MIDLYPELREAAFAVRQPHLNRLRALGCSTAAIAELGMRHHPFGVVRAAMDKGGLYQPSDTGAPCLVVPVYEDGTLIDLVAFNSSAPDEWGLRTSNGWLLGLLDGFEPYMWADTVTLHRSPLQWLQAGGEGLCVLDWDAAEIGLLRDLPRIAVNDLAVKRQLVTALNRPRPIPEIIIHQEEARLVA